MKLDREQNAEVLRQAAMILEKENRRLVDENVALQRRILALEGKSPDELQTRLAALEEQLAAMRERIFGSSSEKRPTAAAPRERAPQTGHGPREQPQLRIADVIHVLDEADLTCPKCGKALEEWEGQHEESEEIDVIERQFVLRKHHRQKYRCTCNGCIETAPGPLKLFPGARYSIDFAIEVAAAKYLDHAPLERQVRTMAREGLIVDSQTLWDVINRLAMIAKDVPEAIFAHVLASAVVGADETRWRLLDGRGRDAGEATNWQAWAVSCPTGIAYRIQDSRSTEAARALIGDYAGTVMADGYGAYQSLRKQGGKFRLAHCWAHVRRKFDEVEAFFPTQCGQVLGLIGELYAVEKLCPTGPPGDELRRKLRSERSREILARIQRWALETRALPESGLGNGDARVARERPREGHRVHERPVGRPHRVRRRSPRATGQQRHRARDAGRRRRAQEPLRLEVAARHRGRGAVLHDLRDREAHRDRPQGVPASRRPRGAPRRARPPPAPDRRRHRGLTVTPRHPSRRARARCYGQAPVAYTVPLDVRSDARTIDGVPFAILRAYVTGFPSLATRILVVETNGNEACSRGLVVYEVREDWLRKLGGNEFDCDL